MAAMAPDVRQVEALHPYVVRVTFADGEVRDVDMESVLDGPAFLPLRDPDYFALVEVDAYFETICWPNGADIDPEVLYGSERPDRGGPTVSVPQRAE